MVGGRRPGGIGGPAQVEFRHKPAEHLRRGGPRRCLQRQQRRIGRRLAAYQQAVLRLRPTLRRQSNDAEQVIIECNQICARAGGSGRGGRHRGCCGRRDG